MLFNYTPEQASPTAVKELSPPLNRRRRHAEETVPREEAKAELSVMSLKFQRRIEQRPHPVAHHPANENCLMPSITQSIEDLPDKRMKRENLVHTDPVGSIHAKPDYTEQERSLANTCWLKKGELQRLQIKNPILSWQDIQPVIGRIVASLKKKFKIIKKTVLDSCRGAGTRTRDPGSTDQRLNHLATPPTK